MEAHWHTEETCAPYHSEQEMGLEKECAVAHLAASWQLLQHQVPCKPDSTHEPLEEGEEEAEAMQGLVVLLSLPDLDPMQHEPQEISQNESLTY